MRTLAPPQSRPTARSSDSAPDHSLAHGAPAARGASLPLFLQALTMPVVQAKLVVNQPGDPYEQEADAVAESVARGGDGAPTPAHDAIAPRRDTPAAAEPAVRPPDSGSALNRNVRARIEPALGADLSTVRVHDSPAARDAAGSIGARAFTHKNHIWLGPNESADDTELLTHEATHVLQQSSDRGGGGHAPSIQRQTAVSSSSPSPVASPAATPVAASMPEATSSSAATLPESTAADASRPSDAGAGPEAAAGGDGAEGAEGAGGGGAEAGGGAAAGGEGGGAEAGPGRGETDAAGSATGAGGGAGGGSMSSESGTTAAPPVVETGAGTLETGDLVLIDVELAEHQRWAGALGRVGAAGSLGRAEFIAEAVGSGFISGAASGLAMGLGIGLVSRAVPAIGPVIGGAMALHGLVSRDWAETGATIGRFGEGNSTYETLANTIASVAAVIDVVSQVLTVINGIVGIVQIAAAVIAGGAVVAAFFTFGATLGIAAVAADVVAVCEEISLGINAVTTVLDTVNAAILQPCVTLFRALHAFTTQADPREVEAQGHSISTAAANSGAALGAWAGGRAAHIGAGGAHPTDDLPPTSRPPHETPPPAAGDGPTVRFSEPTGAPAHAEGGPAAAPHAEAPLPVAPVETGPAPAAHPEAAPPPLAPAEAAAPPAAHVEAAPAAPAAAAAAPAPVDVPAAGAAAHAPVDAAAAGGGGAPGGGAPGGGGGAPGGGGPPAGGGGAGAPPPVEYALTGRRPEPGGVVIHEYGRPGVDTLEHLDVDATVAALDPDAPAGAPRATSDTFFELPAGRDTAGGGLPPHGLQDFDIRMSPNPAQIQYHENMSFEGVTTARIAEHGTVAPGERGGTVGAPGTPHTATSVLPDNPGRVTTSAVPVRGPASPRAGEPWPVEVRTHSANPSPDLAAAAPHAHSRFNPTTQVNTSRGHYLLPDGRWVPVGHPDIGGGHYPVGGRDRGPAGLGEIPGPPGGVPTPPGPGPAPGGGGGAPPPPPGPGGGAAPPVAPAAPPVAPAGAAPAPAPHVEPTSTPSPPVGDQLSFAGMDAPSSPPPAAPHPAPTGATRQPITPDVEIRGEFRDSSLRTVTSDQSGRAADVGEVGPHQWQGNRGGGVRESEHVIPGAQMRDMTADPAHGNTPDWQRSTPSGESDGRDYNRAPTIVEHAVVSDRKTALDNPATRALQASGGPRNPAEDLLLPSLARHQQAVDDAIAAGEITPAQATDPTHRALAAQAEMWGAGEAAGGARARAAEDAGGPAVSYPRRADRAREAEAARLRARLAGEHIEEPDWEATFPNPNRALPPGTQLALPGMEHMAPRPAAGPAPEQLTLPGVSTHPSDPNQLSLPFGAPPAGPTSAPPTTPPPTSGPPPAAPTPAAPMTPAPAPPVHAAPATATASPAASPTAPPASSAAHVPPATSASTTSSTVSAAAGAARTAVASPTTGATGATGSGGEVSWGTRAHQVGELFLPQVFGSGGEAPTYAQQQAAHRARFTDDNQPAEGVERVNPEYPPPPATPAEINAIQDEIMNLLTVRAAAEQEAENQRGRADRCEENQGPIRTTIDDTAAGISAVQAHDAAVARRTALNQEQQQRQQESQGLVAGYPSRATGLMALSVPLDAWQGFTSLASHLPGEAGDSMLRMNREARQMQNAFTQMGAEMLGVETAGPAREAELHGDQGRLESTADQAEVSDGQLNTASEGAAGLQDANEAALAEANQREEAATGRADECTEGIGEREARADSLAEQLRAWAAAHAAARQAAIAATEQRLVSEGRTVLSRSER